MLTDNLKADFAKKKAALLISWDDFEKTHYADNLNLAMRSTLAEQRIRHVIIDLWTLIERYDTSMPKQMKKQNPNIITSLRRARNIVRNLRNECSHGEHIDSIFLGPHMLALMDDKTGHLYDMFLLVDAFLEEPLLGNLTGLKNALQQMSSRK